MAQETPAKQLYDLLISRDFDDLRAVSSQTDKTPVNDEGQQDVGLADLFSFDWHSESGKNYGTVLILLRSDGTVMLEFGNNLGKTIDSSDRQQWFDFMLEIKNFAVRNFMAFEAVNLGKIRHSLHGQRNIREGLLESWTGRRDVSWNADPGQTRLVIKHRRALGEGEARHHQIESLFVETADDQRFRLPFRNLTAGRAMLEHVRAGGRPWDVRGAHIAQMVSELAVLSRFRRANAGRLLEGDTATLVEQTNGYYTRLQRCLRGMATATGYRDYFESWQPTEISEESVVIEGLKHLFVTQTIDQRIEDALPLLARIQQQEKIMKEADIFESWASRLVEGTWQLPDTPEKQTELIELLSQELPVGVDAVNATGQLQDILGDDELFDRLTDLADRDPNANAWDDSAVMDRMWELADASPELAAALTQIGTPTGPEDDQPGMAEEVDTGEHDARRSTHKGETTPEQEKKFRDKVRQYGDELEQRQKEKEQGVAEGSKNNSTIAQKIFFARSDKTPKGWSYDHVGFITQDGRQIQMSGHKGNDVYVTNDVTDDPEFPKQNIKIVSLSKPVSVPTTNTVGAENCGTFVANVLQANGIKGIDTQKIYSVFKKHQEQGVAEDSLNELSSDLLQRSAQVAKDKSKQAMDPKIHDALGGGYKNPLARHYDSLSQKFDRGAEKAKQRDTVKTIASIASPAVMRKIGIAEQDMSESASFDLELARLRKLLKR